MQIEQIGESVENLQVLRGFRHKHQIFLITSHKASLVAAMQQGFCGIPVTKYVQFDDQDFQLRILEFYLIQLQFQKDTLAKNINDFGYLLQK